MKGMNEYEMECMVREALLLLDKYYEEDVCVKEHIRHIRPFGAANLLSKHYGLVVTLQDGSEFQITVLQSKLPEDE